MRIETRNLILRDFEIVDFDSYHRLRSQAKFQRFYPEDKTTEIFSRKLVEQFMSQSLQHPRTHFQFAIIDRVDQLIGSCGVRIVGDQIASIGCEFGTSFQGKGYAIEAGEMLLDFAFSSLKLKEVFAETNSENFAALRLCRNLGMSLKSKQAGYEVFKGRVWDRSILQLSSEDWFSRKNSESMTDLTKPFI